MDFKTKPELLVQIQTNFPDNNTKKITPAKMREFESNNVYSLVHTFLNGIPSVGQDSTQGYIANKSRIIDFNTQIEYLCVDATEGAAEWQAQSGDQITFNAWEPSFIPDGTVCTSAVLDTNNYLFSRSGNIVTISFAVIVSLDFSAGTNGGFTINSSSLPIPSTTALGIGVGQTRSDSVESINCIVNQGEFTFYSSIGALVSDVKTFFTFQYSIN